MTKLDKKNIEDILTLTPMQEGMLFHYLKDPGSETYFEQLSLEIAGEIDFELFEQAWNFVIETNEMLRAVFRWEKIENPVQIILKKHQLQPKYYDLSGKKGSEKKTLLENLKDEERKEKFDLRKVPFRVTLCKVEENKYEMIISNHHILYDGWSNGIILREFFDGYEALHKNPQVLSSMASTPIKTKFKRFLQGIQNRAVNEDTQFWEKYLEGFHNEKSFPGKRRKRREIKSTGNYQIKMPDYIKNTLEEFVKTHNITVASLFYSVWGLLLQEYNSTNDVLFDTTVSGRGAKINGIEDIVGLFINTLPLRVNTHPNEKISDFLSRNYLMLQRWEEFENSSLVNINEFLEKCHSNYLFDSVVVIENYPLDRILLRENSTLSVKSFSISGMTRYDLTVIVTVFDDITLRFIYDNELFTKNMIIKLANDVIHILKNIMENPQKKISALTSSQEEIRGLIAERHNRPDTADQVGIQKNEFSSIIDYSSPGDRVEEKLVEIWAELFQLELTALDIDANFFDFGGHSLKALLLRNMIKKEFLVKMPLAEVFKLPTIRKMARFIKESTDIEDKFVSIEAVEEEQYYELSSAQKRIYNLQQMDMESTAYNVSSFMELQGAVNKDTAAAIEKVLNQLIQRHECLRTSFQLVNGEPRQKIHDSVEMVMEYYCTERGGQNIESKEERHVPCAERYANAIKNFIRPFDLSQVPLLRVGLNKINEARCLLMLDMHHIVTDAVSMNIFIKEFNAFYKGDHLLPLHFQYKDFSQWQNHRLRTGQLKRQESYWLEEFSDELPMLNILHDFRRPQIQSFEGDREYFILDKKLTRQLHQYIRETETTLFILLLAVFNVLLYKYTAQEDIIIGSTVAGRSYADLDYTMGLFIETIVLRNYPTGNKTFAAFLQEVKERTLIAFENTDYPFRELMKKVGDTEDLGRNPLFSTMLIVQNVDMAELEIEGLSCIPIPFASKVSKVDLTLEAAQTNEEIHCHIEYCTKLFKQETIGRMAGHLMNILKEVTIHPKRVLAELEIMSEEEKHQILKKFRENRRHWEKQEELEPFMTHQLFEQQVKQTPDSIAIEYKDKQFTYKQLDKKADHLAKVINNLS